MKSIEKQILELINIANTVQAKELIDIYEIRGYKEITIRNTLSQLKKIKSIEPVSRGTYRITEYGQKAAKSLNNKRQHVHESFDNNWCVVIMQIPEKRRKQKDAFKSVITDLGFAQYYSNIYISPWDYKTAVCTSLERLDLKEYANIIKGPFSMTPVTSEQAYRLWNIPKLETLYKQEEQWITKSFSNIEKTIRDSDDLTLFNSYLDLDEHIDNILLQDPFLPITLLPKNWIGNQILKRLTNLHNLIGNTFHQNSRYNKFIKKQNISCSYSQ